MQAARILFVRYGDRVEQDIKGMLEGLGYGVVAVVQDGDEAIHEASEKKPDLLLMHVSEARTLACIEAAAIIRERYAVPCLCILSRLDEQTLDRAKRARATGYVVEPFTERELCAAIERVLYGNQRERQLEESEKKFRFLAENFPDMISRHDPSAAFLYASSQSSTIIGYAPHELVGQPLFALVHPADLLDLQEAWSRGVSVQRSFRMACRMRHRSGDYVRVHTDCCPVVDPMTNQVSEVTAVSRRIPEREHVSELLRDVSDTCGELVGARAKELDRLNAHLSQETESYRRTAKELQDHRAQLAIHDDEVRRIREVLEQSREELAELYDQAAVGYVGLDAEQRIHSVNVTACSILGAPRDGLVGKALPSFASTAHDASILQHHCDEAFATGIPQSCKVGLTRSDGTRFHAAVESVAIKDTANGLIFCRSVISDISDRLEAEKAQHRWAQVFQHAEWGVALNDPQKRVFTIMNPAFARMHGYTISELTGKPITDVIAPPGHRDLDKHIREAEARGHHTFEAKDVRHDGTAFPVLVNVTSVKDENGTLLYHIANVQDISELKRVEQALRESEARFRALFESAKDCLFVKDRSLRYTHVNPAAERLLDRPASEIVGTTAVEIFGKQAARHLKQLDLRVLAGQSIDHVHAVPVNGVLLTFHDVMVPLRDAEGNITGICCISRNVTDLKSLAPVPTARKRAYRSKAMAVALDQARFAASTDATVLLLGESGTGKDYIARWIHEHSRRASGEFFAINCAALPHELAESELFGHEAGAFTGAVRRKRGLLELAEGGTLLLNEIGELSLPLQSKLLTFLDTRSFVRVGGETSIHVNARLIAATHRDLKACVDEGRFLQPLFFRLNVFALEIPALRQRIEDIPMLVQEMLEELASEMQLPHVEPVPASVLERLCCYHWPGNVRELRNVLERALMISGTGVFDNSLPLPHTVCHDWNCSLSFSPGRTLYDMREELTQALCAEALRRSQGNRTEAARLLGISRHSLYRFMKEVETIGEKPTAPDE